MVKDEPFEAAVFNECASSPAALDAARALDAYSCLPGNDGQQSDATSAYTQSFLAGTETWVSLPADRWPESWRQRKFVNPVVKLVLNLYGHPEAGKTWEHYYESHVKSIGFQPIDNHRSCFFHDKENVFMVVYVDDIKMAGPPKGLSMLWTKLRKKIRMDESSARTDS